MRVCEGRDRQRVDPESGTHRRHDPEVGREQELPDRADGDRRKHEGGEEREPKERPSPPDVGDEHGEQQPEPGLEHDRHAREQDRVQQAPMEDRVAEDRPGVVLEADESGQIEAPACRAR